MREFALVFVLMLAMCLLIEVSADRNIIFACEESKQCESGYAMRICSDEGFEYSQCSYYFCTYEQIIAVNLTTCSTDLNGNGCSSGVCFYAKNIHACYDSIIQCPTLYSEVQTCYECLACETGKCYSYQGLVQCYPYETCEYDKVISTISECPDHKDEFGDECTCCQRTQITGANPDYHSGTCTDQFPELMVDQLIAYIKENDEKPPNGQITEQCKVYQQHLWQNYHLNTMSIIIMSFLINSIL